MKRPKLLVLVMRLPDATRLNHMATQAIVDVVAGTESVVLFVQK